MFSISSFKETFSHNITRCIWAFCCGLSKFLLVFATISSGIPNDVLRNPFFGKIALISVNGLVLRAEAVGVYCEAGIEAGLSPRSRGIDSWSFHEIFLVNKLLLRLVFLRVLRFSPISIIPPLLHTHLDLKYCYYYEKDKRAELGKPQGVLMGISVSTGQKSTLTLQPALCIRRLYVNLVDNFLCWNALSSYSKDIRNS